METKGFVLMATTHPYFGRMAANLASSIKAAAPDSKIAVLADDIALSHLNQKELALFDHRIDVREFCKDLGMVGALRARLFLPEFTPFDLTISLDVDMLWLPKGNPEHIFSLLKDRDFTIVNEGYIDLETGKDFSNPNYIFWADFDELKEAYDLKGRLYKVRGEFIVFRNNELTNGIFKHAREIQEDPLVDVQKLAGSITDEFALNIALNWAGVEPHLSRWEPAYWPAMHGNFIPQVHKLVDYQAISFGGKFLPREGARIHKIIVDNAARKNGLTYRFPIHEKRYFLPERRTN